LAESLGRNQVLCWRFSYLLEAGCALKNYCSDKTAGIAMMNWILKFIFCEEWPDESSGHSINWN
jgi:hypothetical protein